MLIVQGSLVSGQCFADVEGRLRGEESNVHGAPVSGSLCHLECNGISEEKGMQIIHDAQYNVDLTSIQLKKSVYRIARNHEQYTPSRASPIRLQ